MTNKELMECVAAEEAGKKIECLFKSGSDWNEKQHECWDTGAYEYRIAPEPMKKEGKWVRREIKKNGLTGSFECAEIDRTIDCLARIPGFGGIDYQSPFDEKRIVQSMVPVMFDPSGEAMTAGFSVIYTSCRPGIPVAAWFWREEK